jgi:hypothetical protein
MDGKQTDPILRNPHDHEFLGNPARDDFEMSLPILHAEVHAPAQFDVVGQVTSRDRHDRAVWTLDPRTDPCTRNEEE